MLTFLLSAKAVASSLFEEGAITVIYIVLMNCKSMLERISNSYGEGNMFYIFVLWHGICDSSISLNSCIHESLCALFCPKTSKLFFRLPCWWRGWTEFYHGITSRSNSWASYCWPHDSLTCLVDKSPSYITCKLHFLFSVTRSTWIYRMRMSTTIVSNWFCALFFWVIFSLQETKEQYRNKKLLSSLLQLHREVRLCISRSILYLLPFPLNLCLTMSAILFLQPEASSLCCRFVLHVSYFCYRFWCCLPSYHVSTCLLAVV